MIDYLRPRLAILDYVKYRRRGLVIGLGIMPSTCEQLVEQRLTAGDRKWSEAGSVAAAPLIVRQLDRTWGASRRLGPLQRAA